MESNDRIYGLTGSCFRKHLNPEARWNMAHRRNHWCLSCNVNLNISNQSEEHIIPNAIGGRLTTNIAVCKNCNSDFGSREDSVYTGRLLMLSNLFNIVRDRGVSPTLKARDGDSKIKISPGHPVEFDPDPQVRLEGNSLRVRVSVPNGLEGEALKKYLNESINKRHPKISISDDPIKTQQVRVPKFTQRLPGYINPDELRTPARTMLSYARQQGFRISQICPLVKFVRGEDIAPPIFAPMGDVVNFTNRPDDECWHSIAIFCPYGSSKIYIYLEIFGVLEYIGIAHIERPPHSTLVCYAYDVIDAQPVFTEFEWLVGADIISQWAAHREIPYERIVKKSVFLDRWYKNQETIVVRRVLRNALSEVERDLPVEITDVEMQDLLSEKFDEIGKRYGLQFESKFQIEREI